MADKNTGSENTSWHKSFHKINFGILLVSVLVCGMAIFFSRAKTREYINYGYNSGWDSAVRAMSYKLRNVKHEVLDSHYTSWRIEFNSQTEDIYNINILNGWERKKYSSSTN
jgi:hypothetical protein